MKLQPPTNQRPYALFNMDLSKRVLLSPSMARLTFAIHGDSPMSTAAADQRVKLFFPYPDGTPSDLPLDDDWHSIYTRMPKENRPIRRTYTIRSLRPGEVDIDFVLHGDEAPASRWAQHASIGSRLQIAAPNGYFEGDPGGYEWRCPRSAQKVLLIGDETALPALSGILDNIAQWPSRPDTEAFIEISHQEDRIPLSDFPELTLNWMIRNNTYPFGTHMIAAASQATLPRSLIAENGHNMSPEAEGNILWQTSKQGENGFYCWIAGETGAVREIRHILIKERGLNRHAANLMGYWRKGANPDDM